MLPINTILANRYKLLDKIGEGGAAAVYRAEDMRLGRIVALKVLRPEYVADAEQAARFELEARSAAALTAPNVVDVYDYGKDGEISFIAMQYIDGQNLKQYLAARGPLRPDEAARIAADVCRALESAHARGLVHRDVKPQNILIDSHNAVRLSDFGIAKALGSPGLTQAGMTYGTAAYLSPEQATGSQIGPYSDVYSMGLVLYEMLCGQPPFQGDNAAAVAYKQVYEQPPPLRACAPGVPPQLEAIVMRALAKAPAARYQSAADMEADLQGFLMHAAPPPPVTVVPAPQSYAPLIPVAVAAPPADARYASFSGVQAAHENRPRRRPIIWIALPLILLLLVAGGFFGSRFLGGLGASATPTAEAGQPLPTATAVVGLPAPSPPPALTDTPSAAAPTDTAVAVAPTDTAVALVPPSDTPEPPTAAPVRPTSSPAGGGTHGRPVFDTPTPPAGANLSLTIGDTAFAGGYRYAPPSIYEGRTAAWVYGQGTQYSSMTAPFKLTAQPTGQAQLVLTGMDSEDKAKTPMRVLVNGQSVYNGADPLPNDYSPKAGSWGSATITLPASVLHPGDNTLTIENLSPSGALGIPFVMINSAKLTWDGEQ
ncbi:MAG: protein kinase domain-containing protein [Chloroflexia bacterium]